MYPAPPVTKNLIIINPPVIILTIIDKKGKKIIIFTGSKETAEYLTKEIENRLGRNVIYFSGSISDSIKNDIKDTEDKMAECQVKIDENKVLHDQLDIINGYSIYVKAAQKDIETLPLPDKAKLDEIDSVVKKQSAEYKGLLYDLEKGSITISQIQVTSQDDVKKLVDALKKVKFIADVNYTGYKGTGKGDDKVIIDELILSFTEVGEE